jgi:acyl transferase domain-containing protein
MDGHARCARPRVNAHVVLEEYVPPARTAPRTNGPFAIVLSARHEARLREQVQALLACLDAQPDVELDELAYTLQVGREAMEERLGFVAGSLVELRATLTRFLAGDGHGLHRGQVRRQKDAPAMTAAKQGNLHACLEAWVKGDGVDWRALYGAHAPHRISLPTYPFARERYALSDVQAPSIVAVASSPHLHPLLHRNTSDVSTQRFSSHFHGEEFFLAGHNVAGMRVLPGVAQLEMALAAARLSTHAHHGLSLRKVTWARPVVVAEAGLDVHVALRAEAEGTSRYEI